MKTLLTVFAIFGCVIAVWKFDRLLALEDTGAEASSRLHMLEYIEKVLKPGLETFHENQKQQLSRFYSKFLVRLHNAGFSKDLSEENIVVASFDNQVALFADDVIGLFNAGLYLTDSLGITANLSSTIDLAFTNRLFDEKSLVSYWENSSNQLRLLSLDNFGQFANEVNLNANVRYACSKGENDLMSTSREFQPEISRTLYELITIGTEQELKLVIRDELLINVGAGAIGGSVTKSVIQFTGRQILGKFTGYFSDFFVGTAGNQIADRLFGLKQGYREFVSKALKQQNLDTVESLSIETVKKNLDSKFSSYKNCLVQSVLEGDL